jgi:RNA polymerase sigma-70 factor (ECF subfamily)
VNAEGELVLLAQQDRARWDHAEIEEAAGLLDTAVRLQRPGPYQLQAAVACLHGLAPSVAATDWPQIAGLYAALDRLQPTAVVRVNRAVAVAEAGDLDGALALLDTLDPVAVQRWHLYWSTRAELLLRAGRAADAVTAFDAALGCSPNDTDRRFLLGRRGVAEGAVRGERTDPA